jgi:hypothetical protein
MGTKNVFSALVGITFISILVFGTLQWLQIPKGTMIDWIIGVIAFWWLLLVVTIPWNMHFQAKEVLDEIRISEDKKLTVNPNDRVYAQKIAKRYLMLALILHLISTVVLYILAYLGISSIGYWGAGIALLLTGLRPALRMQAYVVQRLSAMKQEIRYPRDDAYELGIQQSDLKYRIENMESILNINDVHSWASSQHQEIASLQKKVDDILVKIKTSELQNKVEHEIIAKKSEETVAKLSEDAQFLNQARELIRFIKSA